jgi:hypothetical protein
VNDAACGPNIYDKIRFLAMDKVGGNQRSAPATTQRQRTGFTTIISRPAGMCIRT